MILLGHNFLSQRDSYGEFFKCAFCNLRIAMDHKIGDYFLLFENGNSFAVVNGLRVKIKLSCDEQIIKNMLE